jgi:hypothetical protein
MLFKNGEKVDLKGTNEDAKRFKKAIEDIEEHYGFPVIFKRSPSYVTPDEDNTGKTFMRTPAFFIPNVSYLSNEIGETDEWRWSPTVPRKRDGEYVFTREHSRTMLDKTVFTLDKNELDKIYFFLYLNPQFKRYYQVDSAKAEATQRVEKKRKEALIYNIFYGDKSILQKDEKKLRTIARAWNIRDIDKQTRDQVLESLETAVREQDLKGLRSVDDFLKATQLDEDTEIGAMIQKAEDMKLIKFDDRLSTWFYLEFNGSLGEKIYEVPKNQKDAKYDMLKDYIFVEKDHISKIKSLVNANDVDEELRLNFDDLEHEDYSKVQEYLSLHGIADTGFGRTKIKVFADIRKHAGKE